MAPSPDDEGDRRGLERRIDTLERRYEALSVMVNEVKGEQKHHGELMALSFKGVEGRCVVLSTENGLIIEKIDKLNMVVNDSIGDSSKSPMGRELLKDISAVSKDLVEMVVVVRALQEQAAEFRGALNFVRNSNIGVIVSGLVILIVVLGRLLLAGKVL